MTALTRTLKMMSYYYPGSLLPDNISAVPARPLVMNFWVPGSAVRINHSARPLGSVECGWKLRSSICLILPSAVPYLSCQIVGHLRSKGTIYVSSYLQLGHRSASHMVGISELSS